jgi:hypothetical protein
METADPVSARHLRQQIQHLDAAMGRLEKQSKPCSRASRSWPAWWSWPTAFRGSGR